MAGIGRLISLTLVVASLLVLVLGGSALAGSAGAGEAWTSWLTALGVDEGIDSGDPADVSEEDPTGALDTGADDPVDPAGETGTEGEEPLDEPLEQPLDEPLEEPLDGDDPAEEEPILTLGVAGSGFELLVRLSTITLVLDGSEPLTISVENAFNHGGFVSALAKAAPKGPGHGEIVSMLARSNAGKKGWADEESEGTEEGTDPGDESSLEPVDPSESVTGGEAQLKKAKPAKSQKAAAKKAVKKAKANGKKGKK